MICSDRISITISYDVAGEPPMSQLLLISAASYRSTGHPMGTVWYRGTLPGDVKITIENGDLPIEIVDLPMNSMVMCHSYVNVYQRLFTHCKPSNYNSCCNDSNAANDHSNSQPNATNLAFGDEIFTIQFWESRGKNIFNFWIYHSIKPF